MYVCDMDNILRQIFMDRTLINEFVPDLTTRPKAIIYYNFETA